MKLDKKDASHLLLILIFLLCAAGITAALIMLQSNPIEDALSSNRVINILFVIEENETPLSTYLLMYYPQTKRAAIFDIPVNIGLLITQINRVDRIDKMYEPSKIGGYENEIAKLLEIDIDFSAVITKENLVSIVDILEGVEIFIPSKVFHRDGDNLIMFPSGMTVLDGDKAAVYAAYSLPDESGEIKTARRQRFFIGLLDRFIKMNESLKNKETAKLYYSFFRTSMNENTLLRLFDELSHIDIGRTNIQSVTGSLREVSGQMLVIPHWDGNLIKEVVRQTVGSLTRQSEGTGQRNLTVEVLNGTTVTGSANRTADMLRNFGYDIVSIGNADRDNYEQTVIINRTGDEGMVSAFADIIRCKNIISEFSVTNPENETELAADSLSIDGTGIQNFDLRADITLIIGRNFDGRYVID